MTRIPPVEELNALEANAFASVVAPLFERAPRFVRRLADERPFATEDELLDAARATAREMPEVEKVELLDAHPRIGADAATISDLSRREQVTDVPTETWVGEELAALNEAYESRFGFRFVVFVAGRPRAEVIPIMERALHADRDEELRRGLDDVVLIAADRLEKLQGPRPLREEIREVIAVEASRWMVGELDRDGFIRATHRLIDEGVESSALLALSLTNPDQEQDLAASVARLMNEIGLEGWERNQAGQLLALHAAASILGDVSQPIDGARRIAAVSGNPLFRELVERWEAETDADAEAERRSAVDAEIRRAAVDLFGEEEPTA